jgi:tetratricopeptide (TPR) repeat protein
MDTVTYPDPNVFEFINKYLIPFRVNVLEAESLPKYQEIWTPTLAILAIKGKEVQRTIGFLGKDELLPVLHLGIAKAHFDHKDFETADVHFKKLLKNHPRSHEVPEAIFFRGVNLYKMKSDPSQLKKAYEQLLSEFPESPWTKRAYPYRLIK